MTGAKVGTPAGCGLADVRIRTFFGKIFRIFAISGNNAKENIPQ